MMHSGFRVLPRWLLLMHFPLTTVGAIVQYHIIPGQQYASADVPTTFPNIQLPSYLTIGALPGTPVPLNMSTFPSEEQQVFGIIIFLLSYPI